MAENKVAPEGNETRHPGAFEPVVLIPTIILSVLGAIVGLNLITTLGISANTSIIGAVIAMLLGRISFFGLSKLRSENRQNLVQSAVSASTFAAANGLLAPIAIPFALGMPELVWPMLLGASIGVLVDVFVLFKVYGSKLFPASNAWPPGTAAAETIKAGSRGGRRALILAAGTAVGIGGSFLSLPMSAAGVALIGNMWSLTMFGIGLLIAQYAPTLFQVDLTALYIPHGLMIGAGIVALFQVLWIIFGSRSKSAQKREAEVSKAAKTDPSMKYTVNPQQLARAFGFGYLAFVAGAVILTGFAGVLEGLPWWEILGLVLFAGLAAIIHELIVGLAAMHAGWFPAFAVTLIFLVIGLLIHIPAAPLVLLVAYCSATGPAFADMGYDYKAGWILRRGHRPYTAFEMDGRKQQLQASVVAILISIGIVAISWDNLLNSGAIPPTSQVFADTITAGVSDPSIGKTMALWAIPGAIIQLVGGPQRQLGVLFATGLLVASPNAGWLVLIGLLARKLWTKWRGEEGEREVGLVGAGLIAGDSLFNLGKIIRI